VSVQSGLQLKAQNGLIEPLPPRLETELDGLLANTGETVCIKLKGAFKEALVCTDKRVIILKAGFVTGQTFGSKAFQIFYRNVTGVQVVKHLMRSPQAECRMYLLATGRLKEVLNNERIAFLSTALTVFVNSEKPVPSFFRLRNR
jgi:hypothetical protein